MVTEFMTIYGELLSMWFTYVSLILIWQCTAVLYQYDKSYIYCNVSQE